MTRARVALTTYPAEDGDVHLPVEYVDSIRRAGAEPFLVPPGAVDTSVIVAAVDGLVLAGGGDVDPATWNGPTHEKIYGTSPDRDRMEIALARLAVDSGLPTLAICRGMQVLNVALGGTLHMHIPDTFGENVAHRAPPREPIPHAVDNDPGSLVARVMGACRVETVSWHHQAVAELGAGLAPVGWAPDGVIETVELEGHPWLVAVQWHPELTAAQDRTQQALFDGLVEQTRRW